MIRRKDYVNSIVYYFNVAVFGKLILLAFKASWGILKVLLTIIIFPLFLIGLFVSGLVYIALILLVIAGIVSVVKSLT